MAVAGQRLIRNTVSMGGIVVATLSAVLFLIVFFLEVLGLHTNPYLGIVFFLILPGFFIGGLLLIPLGLVLARRRQAAGRPIHMGWPRLDLNEPAHRRAVLIVMVLTLVNVVIVSLAAYRGIEFMDSPTFCGQVCHEVMEPEYAAYQDGPHSRVACVQCHIGPGAPWFVKSKLSGTRQVFAVLLNSHSRPIESPVTDLRPARDTCEQCHWPEKFHGDMVQVRREFADDEAGTETATTLRVHVGGGSEKIGVATGIHWHMNIANQVDYIATDDKRQVIPYVRVQDRTGAIREYYAEGTTEQALAGKERRRMDCVDCHNRPSHPFSPSPERAVDGAIASGELQRSLPFVRREAVAALKGSYPDQASADQQIATRMTNFYQAALKENYTARRPEVEHAIQVTQRLFGRNVFPKMKVTWGTHPNNIGHVDSPGCFRCHDDQHKTQDGRVIKQDCELCHDIS
jgi:hypothetical protein